MKKNRKWLEAFTLAVSGAGLAVLAGCSPMMAGQVAEAGYNAARTTLGVDPAASTAAVERQKRLQTVMNSIEIGQDVQPVLDQIGEPPKIKSGNAYGYTCYEFPSVYSAQEGAVIVAHAGKVVFYGSSQCNSEMQDANFRKDGKYTVTETPQVENAASPD